MRRPPSTQTLAESLDIDKELYKKIASHPFLFAHVRDVSAEILEIIDVIKKTPYPRILADLAAKNLNPSDMFNITEARWKDIRQRLADEILKNVLSMRPMEDQWKEIANDVEFYTNADKIREVHSCLPNYRGLGDAWGSN